MLQAFGYDVRTASSGPEALGALRACPCEVGIIDIALPMMDGNEVARRIRSEFNGKLVLFALTGYGRAADRHRSIAAGFDYYLTKPVDIDLLEKLLPHSVSAVAPLGRPAE